MPIERPACARVPIEGRWRIISSEDPTQEIYKAFAFDAVENQRQMPQCPARRLHQLALLNWRLLVDGHGFLRTVVIVSSPMHELGIPG